MDVTVVMIGVGDWERYTLPALDSLYQHEPRIKAVCLDNGSTPPYPVRDDVRRSDVVLSYPAAINRAMELAPSSDLYIVINNDVLFMKPFLEKLVELDLSCLYGFWMHKVFAKPYLSSWCLLIPRRLWDDVGDFDESFAPMWYEDADYCIRAGKAGYPLVELNREQIGIHHFAPDRVRERLDYIVQHSTAMDKNKEYLRVKHGL